MMICTANFADLSHTVKRGNKRNNSIFYFMTHTCLLLAVTLYDDMFCRYNKYTKHIMDLAKKIKELEPEDPFRTTATSQLLEKL